VSTYSILPNVRNAGIFRAEDFCGYLATSSIIRRAGSKIDSLANWQSFISTEFPEVSLNEERVAEMV
jgi:hypothetical protein